MDVINQCVKVEEMVGVVMSCLHRSIIEFNDCLIAAQRNVLFDELTARLGKFPCALFPFNSRSSSSSGIIIIAIMHICNI